MSLDWSLKGIRDWETVCYVARQPGDPNYPAKGDPEWRFEEDGTARRLHWTTNALIWAAMVTQLTGITEANAAEWTRRLDLWEHAMHSFLLGDGGKPVYLTEADVRRHIGLHTNVFPAYSARKWDGWFAKALANKARDDARYRAEKAAKGANG